MTRNEFQALEKVLPNTTQQFVAKLEAVNFQMDINQEKIHELRNRMEKDAETLKRDFRAYDSKLDNTTTK